MKPEIKELNRLLKLAVANPSSPITEQDVLLVLNNIEQALGQNIPCSPNPSAMLKNLKQAGFVLSCFIYLANNRQSFISEASRIKSVALYNKITASYNASLDPLINTQPVKLLPLKTFSKTIYNLGILLQARFAGTESYNVLAPHIEAACTNKMVTYNTWLWWSHFCHHANRFLQTDSSGLEDLLTLCSFNCPGYLAFLYNSIDKKFNGLTAREISFFISDELVKYKCLQPLTPCSFLPAALSIKKAMLSFLKTRKRSWENCTVTNPTPLQSHPKTMVNLSVPQMALFIKLFIEAGLIKSENHTAFLRHLAGALTTPNTNIISADSLRANFYSPGDAAKKIVKDQLFLMINQLKTH